MGCEARTGGFMSQLQHGDLGETINLTQPNLQNGALTVPTSHLIGLYGN